MMKPIQNPTTLWATTFVHALAASGLDAVCIAPGSRSTPLTLAFDAHPDIEVFVHLDERSAGFFALGRALATGKPVALVCTSGTAVANFFPALIEANMSHVSLLILTADRPPELRHSGANQTIDQVKIFGDQVLWSVDLDTPQADAPEVALRNVAQTAARAYATANGLRQGPVHVNLPFRKPLEPDKQSATQLVSLSVAQHERGQIAPSAGQVAQLQSWVEQYESGVIVCGPRCPGGDFPQAVVAFSQATGYPILADPLSGVRFGPWVNGAVLGGYESWLTQNQDPPAPVPDIVIRFGQVPTSKWLNAYLERIDTAVRLHIRQNGVWADDSQRTTHFWQCDEVALMGQVSSVTGQGASLWAALEAETWERVARFMDEHFFDATAVSLILDSLPDDLNLIMGNSLPIRHLDQFGRPRKNAWRVFGNRGASGIDGNTSTAVGIASATPNRPTLLITGDVTFYHDLNGLLAINHNQIHNISIVLLNNGGGGIFNRLPVANHEPAFTPLFKTPHHLDFTHAAALFGLAHVRVHGRADLQTALASDWLSRPTILEIMTDNEQDEQLRRDLVRQLRERL
ncbi:MAG: 2-succinyl-5-enolpyruvyl-6-hydroxy-3-cyclohexene-1-carboxylic-acid synthase [Anaerolineales bacterium]|nr:2-succinyl-5-enolpyruvyl-6-hydroxy-3-cyclohexene-1-carboxylic-acid synthase [Anaerolineales bacterium]